MATHKSSKSVAGAFHRLVASMMAEYVTGLLLPIIYAFCPVSQSNFKPIEKAPSRHGTRLCSRFHPCCRSFALSKMSKETTTCVADNGASRDRLQGNCRSLIHSQVVFTIVAGHDFQPMVVTLWRRTPLLLLLLNAFN